jgi:hypothetical protein
MGRSGRTTSQDVLERLTRSQNCCLEWNSSHTLSTDSSSLAHFNALCPISEESSFKEVELAAHEINKCT